MSLATYSRELKVFSAQDGYSSPVIAPIRSNNPTRGRITWSGDGKWLAVAPLDRGGGGPLPIFKYSNKQLQPMTYVTLPNILSASFFNWTNRHIAVGNERGEVFVWDIKDKKIAVKVEYLESQPVDMISVNSDDMYIASGSLTSNKVCLHGLKTNKVVNTLSIQKSKETSSLKFCLCKKNYLGASSMESTVCIWDIARSDYVFKKYQAHAGACTDISFSPINYDVLASVSLTKTLKMYDIREGKTVLEENIGEPLNCVDIILNGDKVALGTTGGSIIIYDLRADKVLQNFKAHDGPVLGVKTQNLKISKSYKEIEINTPEVVEIQSRTIDISVMDVFSPITRNSAKDISNCLLSQSKMLPTHSTPNLIGGSLESPSTYDDSFFKKVLSPLPQQQRSMMSSSKLSPFLCPIKEKPDPVENSKDNVDVNVKIKKELSSLVVDNKVYNCDVDGGGGDTGGVVENSNYENYYSNDLLNEIRAFQKVILSEIGHIKEEINSINKTREFEMKCLREDIESLKKLIIDDVKQEIQAGTSRSILNHAGQRLLINELNEVVLASEEKMSSQIQLNAFRLMHIYEAVKQMKKS